MNEKTVKLNKIYKGLDHNTKLIEKSSVSPKYTKPFVLRYPIIEKFFPQYETKHVGLLTGEEVQHSFELYQNKHYSLELCQLIVQLLNLDRNKGNVKLKEFESFYNCTKNWVNAFRMYDRNNSGCLDEIELDFALRHLDIPLSIEFIRFLIKRKDPHAKKMSLDQFLVVCIQMQEFTKHFETLDSTFVANVNISYDDYVLMMMKKRGG